MPLADEILRVLDDPTYMWSHALREASQDSQRLFLTLPLLPQPISTDDLQVAYSAQKFSQTETFLDSLRALEDSFISIGASVKGRRLVNFRNPSLQDFAQEYLNRHTDWLDRLLSKPVYYEQIINVYNLAMSRLPESQKISAGPPYKFTHQEGELRFTETRSWVGKHHQDLLGKAIHLALSRSDLRGKYRYLPQRPDINLKELVDYIQAFGEPSDNSTIHSFGKLITEALQPSDEPSAQAILDLLRTRNTADIVERYSSSEAIETLRTNLIDKDTWKFSILSKIDEFLEIDAENSMNAWGHDYIDHVGGWVYEMSQSTDYDDLDNAIDELRDISSLLGVDLFDSIEELEGIRDNLPPERDDDDYESYSSSRSKDSDSSRELDNVFASLLG